eukprot:2549603-Rhodomonas_salina.1
MQRAEGSSTMCYLPHNARTNRPILVNGGEHPQSHSWRQGAIVTLAPLRTNVCRLFGWSFGVTRACWSAHAPRALLEQASICTRS